MPSPDSFPSADTVLQSAIALVAQTPGYETVGADLLRLLQRGRLQFVPTLEDRGQATLGGCLLLGPEALGSSPLGLAETLVHEMWHLRRQSPLAKTASFWIGVATGKPVMRRYEAPAYQSALRFLATVESTFPEWAGEARSEQEIIRASFDEFYGGPLSE